jgi:hypothetical protein
MTVKLRPHHIGMFIDDKGNLIQGRPLLFYLQSLYDRNLVGRVLEISSGLTPNSKVEIVRGKDDLCSSCPFGEPCGARDYGKMIETIKSRAPRYIYQDIEISLLKGHTPEKEDESIVQDYGLETKKYSVKELCAIVKAKNC